MVQVTVCVREPGNPEVDYSLDFDLPEIPRPGDYISIHRSDKETPHTEDVVVRHVWWMLETEETATIGQGNVGKAKDIFVECDMAIGPYATDKWRQLSEGLRQRGRTVEEFDVARFSVRESDIGK